MRSFRPRLAGALGVALVGTTLALGFSAPAQAARDGLVISEVFGANGTTNLFNQDYVEVYNPTDHPIDASNYSVQYKSAAGANPTSKVDLAGLIPAGGYFLAGGAVATGGTSIPTPDAANTNMNLSGTAGVIVLAKQKTLLTAVEFGTHGANYTNPLVADLVGYGTTADTFEGGTRAAAPSNTTGIYRKQADTDVNGSDFAVTSATNPASPTACDCFAPTFKITEVYTDGGAAGATHDHDYVELYNPNNTTLSMNDLTLQYRGPAATGPAQVVATLSGTMAATSYDIVELGTSGTSGTPVADIQYTNHALDLSAAGGTLMLVKKNATGFDPGTGDFAGSQYVADLVGWGSTNAFEETTADASGLSATRSITRAPGAPDTDNNADDFTPYAPTPNTSPVTPVKTIAEIQGAGATSPVNNALVTTSGVVTAAYPRATGDFAGFYLQTAGSGGTPDATPGASDGVFVYTGLQTISPAVGDKVTVTGKVTEFFGMTELTVTRVADYTNSGPATAPEAVNPQSVLPGTECALPGTDCLAGAALESAREAHEGELFQPTQPYTVSDSYDGTPWTQGNGRGSQMAGEIGLAANDEQPLLIATEVASPRTDPQGIADRNRYNAAHMITLDDGANVNYANVTGSAFPWLALDHTVRMGAAVTFPKPVVLDYRNDLWKIQPQGKVTGAGDSLVSLEQDRPAAPEDVLGETGDLKIATFNMLNYFNTTGEAWDNSTARHCTYYSDRAGAHITNNTCEEAAVDPVTGLDTVLPGPRGAANQVNFERQEAKELEAINTMDADVMSLEEVENSTKIGDANRDDALIRLVQQLNLHWANAHASYVGDRWDYVPSPRTEAQPTLQEQDAIRSAFIYNPSKVETVGRSRILVNSAPFRNAREPLAQAFKPLGSGRANAFGVVVNHFKSKGGPTAPATVNGDNVDAGDGDGFYNGDRKRQAASLVAFADQFAADKNIEAMFLTGDYNAYAMEDPIQVIKDAGYHDLHPANGEKTYSFGGLAGSLDHVFANGPAHDMVTGTDVWSINANEPVFYEYSRYNYNATNLYAVNPFRSSDHNPEIIGINSGGIVPDTDVDTVRILATNDFHGRILDDPGSAAAGAASLAGAVKELRAGNSSTIFAAAGDLIGASTFESFIANDKPTIDALNEAGLEVSAAGNHEFDRGYRDLVDRVMTDYDPETNPEGGAKWKYIAANVRFKNTEDGHDAGDAALPETWYRKLPNGKTVGFVGAVTEDLPALVAGDGISEIEVTDIVDSVNTHADELKAPGGCADAEGCDLVVMLVHEGAANTSYSAVTDDSTFAHIVSGADENIDAIVSGHTHLAYNHKVPVPEWSEEGRAVTRRPVVSAGQYGANLNSLEFEYLPGTDELVNIRQTVLALKDYDADGATQDIVAAAVDAAAEVGDRPLGDIEGPFQRARRHDPVAGGDVENRGGESTLGNLVAEIQRWKTGADIGFMNPGGLRADMIGALEGDSRVLTYRQAADVQPFANTLVTMDLTGSQIKTILEQQWQRDADGNIPSRPFLRLGTSKGFASTYDASRDEGDRITGMWLEGEPIDLDGVYRVAATSFLASGTGDNFWGFDEATNEQDTGKTDLEAVVDYMAANAAHGLDTLPVDFRQHAVGVTFPAGAPSTYAAGDRLTFDVSSLAMTGPGDLKDDQVELLSGGTVLGTFDVTNSLTDLPFDEAGTASVAVDVPAGVADGTTEFTLRGVTTGTTVTVPVSTMDGLATLNLLGINDFHGRINSNTVKFAGTVEQLTQEGGEDHTVLVGAGDLIGASEFASAIAKDQPTIDVMNALGLDASAVGNHEFDQGWVDLRDRVIGRDGNRNALWDYLGANVYANGTTDPVLPEYALLQVDGVSVGVVGAVTEETSSLVSPAGIADIDFGNPADAVNRVAGELSDGDPANGEADVIVASFHAGARQGTGSNYAAELAKGGEFAEMATLDPAVDAIFNGHTHQVYAWDAPVPGEPNRTRPIVQTGEYGANVGQVTMTVDRATGDVQSYTVRNVARTSRTDSDLVAAYPRVAEVKQIVDKALSNAAAIGNQPVGQISGDITRAFRVGTYGPGGYEASRASGNEDRSAESTMGGLVGNALRDGLPADMGTPDLGLVNPGGLREDLLYAGNTATNPDNTDGIVTYAEANSVLPFVNNVSLVDLTGAELVQVLEEQWQRPAPGGPAPSRPYLQVGLSDNVEVTADASRPLDSRITSVRIDGEPVDPAATYTVSTFSFLAAGGDNFHTFKEGVARDTGLVDRDLWVSYLQRTMEEGAAPIAPDFARQQVFEREMPTAVDPGQHVEFTLGADLVAPWTPVTGEKLDLSSLGSPVNTTVSITAAPADGTPQLLGSVPVSGGTAAVAFDVPDSIRTGGEIVLEAKPSGTTVTVPVTVPVRTVTSATADPMVYGTAGEVAVTVTSTRETTGTVQLLDGETLVATGAVAPDGTATLSVPGTALPAGQHTLTVKYRGDGSNEPSEGTVDLVVASAASTLTATVTPNQVVVHSGKATVQTAVTASGYTPTGDVEVYVDEVKVTSGALTDGTAALEVGPFVTVGTHSVVVRYLGDAGTEPSSSDPQSVTVVKATPTMRITASPDRITTKSNVGMTVTLTAPGQVPTGTVTITWAKKEKAVGTLTGGQVVLPLGQFSPAGDYTFKVSYPGSPTVEAATSSKTITVLRK